MAFPALCDGYDSHTPTLGCPSQADPERAARIAAAGRRFACGFLTEAPRRRFWQKLLRRYAAEVQAYPVTRELLLRRHAAHRLWVFEPRDVACKTLFTGNYCILMADLAGLQGQEEIQEEAFRRAKEGVVIRDGWWDGLDWWQHDETRGRAAGEEQAPP